MHPLIGKLSTHFSTHFFGILSTPFALTCFLGMQSTHSSTHVSSLACNPVLHTLLQGEVRGWKGADDSPEEVTGSQAKSDLCLLACAEGVFLPVEIQKQVGMMRAVSAVLLA